MNFLQILLLGIIQGAAELLPVSSSAHVIVAEKLMGLDPSTPELTFLLVMLHTGTMLAVIVYFWKSWGQHYFSSLAAFQRTAVNVAVATALTGSVYLTLALLIKTVFMRHVEKAEVELLFGKLPLIWGALLAVGLLIIYSGRRSVVTDEKKEISLAESLIIGAVQGLCLPFRGFSRSGATISTGLLLGIGHRKIEEFSFALAVVLTPVAILKELHRLVKAHAINSTAKLLHLATPGLLGMVCSFGAGLLALAFLSKWLEAGKWKFFGYYCILASVVVLALWLLGY